MSKFGGGGAYSKGRDYPYRPMNSLVYPVNGGMEDWAYAASWETTEQNKVGDVQTHRGRLTCGQMYEPVTHLPFHTHTPS